MKAELIKIGNSQGIRIPKAIIEQCAFGKNVELTIRDNCLIVSAETNPRQDWDKAFQAMAANSDDRLLDEHTSESTWDDAQWQW